MRKLDLIIGAVSNRPNTLKILPYGRNKHDEPVASYSAISISGRNGSGKSQTAAFLVQQYAIDGAKLVFIDYEASKYNDDTLSERCKHLGDAMYLEPVRDTEDVLKYLRKITELRNKRENGLAKRFPIVFIFDEFTNFLLEDDKEVSNAAIALIKDINKMRKENITFIAIGQTFAQITGNKLASLRKAMGVNIVHNSSEAEARFFLTSDLAKIAPSLPTGFAFYDSELVYVPSYISEDTKNKTRAYIQQMYQQTTTLQPTWRLQTA